MTQYSREVSELGEYGDGANDNGPPEVVEDEGREIGDVRPDEPEVLPGDEDTTPPPAAPQTGS
jgi:hypothetical protein